MFILCLIIILFSMLMKPVKKLFLILIRGSIGLGAIYGFNILLKGIGLYVGVNIVNGFIVGILGIPGFVLLYSLAIVDKFL
ncbi:MAG: pro-sigmaK processing inhibitor BofA family protein [Vallitalea sp.]|nr:pro-sigmaK processing inhibitor BofA family protein [Vallitalea sp.]